MHLSVFARWNLIFLINVKINATSLLMFKIFISEFFRVNLGWFGQILCNANRG